jgi:hypothetical protein
LIFEFESSEGRWKILIFIRDKFRAFQRGFFIFNAVSLKIGGRRKAEGRRQKAEGRRRKAEGRNRPGKAV